MMSIILLLACQDSTLNSANDAPVVTIVRPADGSTFDPASPVAFCAQVDDELSGDDLEFLLESGVDGVLADRAGEACEGGNAGWVLTLSNTDHLLSLFATDASGQLGRTTLPSSLR